MIGQHGLYDSKEISEKARQRALEIKKEMRFRKRIIVSVLVCLCILASGIAVVMQSD